MSNKTYPEDALKTSWESKTYDLLYAQKLSNGSAAIVSASLEAWSLKPRSSTVVDADVTDTFLVSSTGQPTEDADGADTKVRFTVRDGVSGVDYLVKCKAVTDTGDKIEGQLIVRVRDA